MALPLHPRHQPLAFAADGAVTRRRHGASIGLADLVEFGEFAVHPDFDDKPKRFVDDDANGFGGGGHAVGIGLGRRALLRQRQHLSEFAGQRIAHVRAERRLNDERRERGGNGKTHLTLPIDVHPFACGEGVVTEIISKRIATEALAAVGLAAFIGMAFAAFVLFGDPAGGGMSIHTIEVSP